MVRAPPPPWRKLHMLRDRRGEALHPAVTTACKSMSGAFGGSPSTGTSQTRLIVNTGDSSGDGFSRGRLNGVFPAHDHMFNG